VFLFLRGLLLCRHEVPPLTDFPYVNPGPKKTIATQLEAWATLLVQHIDDYYLHCQQFYGKRIAYFGDCTFRCAIHHWRIDKTVTNSPHGFPPRLIQAVLRFINGACER
jgi:hypothetical protein